MILLLAVDSKLITAPHDHRFMKMLQNYQNMEMKQRDRSRQRIERQYLIAKPNASAEEVRLAVESGQDVQVFAQAVSGIVLVDLISRGRHISN